MMARDVRCNEPDRTTKRTPKDEKHVSAICSVYAFLIYILASSASARAFGKLQLPEYINVHRCETSMRNCIAKIFAFTHDSRLLVLAVSLFLFFSSFMHLLCDEFYCCVNLLCFSGRFFSHAKRKTR